ASGFAATGLVLVGPTPTPAGVFLNGWHTAPVPHPLAVSAGRGSPSVPEERPQVPPPEVALPTGPQRPVTSEPAPAQPAAPAPPAAGAADDLGWDDLFRGINAFLDGQPGKPARPSLPGAGEDARGGG